MNNPRDWLAKRLSSILMATDLHQNSRLALDYAAKLARAFDSQLRSLHVFEFGPYGKSIETIDHVLSTDRTDAQAALERFLVDAGHPEVIAEVAVDETFVTTAILKVLATRNVDLLVLGTAGLHRGVDHLLLGSNTEALMLGSQHLILTVGPDVPDLRQEEIRFDRVSYISDFSVASTAAARYAFAFAESFGTKADIYHLASKAAVQDLLKLERAAAQYCEFLRFADPQLPTDWYDTEAQLSKIITESEVSKITSDSSNLLVLGVQPSSFLQRHLHTSLAYRLLAGARSPVLTVPADFHGSRNVPAFRP